MSEILEICLLAIALAQATRAIVSPRRPVPKNLFSICSHPDTLASKMKHRELTATIIDCAYKVHKKLGFGFLESVYQNAFVIELSKTGLQSDKEKRIQVYYGGQVVGDFIADILVEGKVIIELKSVKEIHPAHEAQLINYLKATGMEVGLLINFGEKLEIKRKVLDHA